MTIKGDEPVFITTNVFVYAAVEGAPQVTSALLRLLETHDIGGKRVHDADIATSVIVNDIPRIRSHNTQEFTAF